MLTTILLTLAGIIPTVVMSQTLLLIPLLLGLLSILKSSFDILANIMKILSDVVEMVKTSWVASQPMQKSIWNVLGNVVSILWTWLKWFIKDILWNGAMVVFHSPTAAAMMIFLLLCATSATRVATEAAMQDRIEEARKQGEHDGYAKGHAEGLKEARAPQKYRPNR